MRITLESALPISTTSTYIHITETPTEIDVVAARAKLHADGGNHEHIAQGVYAEADIHKLVGKELLVRVGKLGLEPERARRDVD